MIARSLDTVTIHIPFRVVKRGGRKEIHLPNGVSVQSNTDSVLVKALARAFRWKRLIEDGELNTLSELAEQEGIAPSYMTRVMRLTLLSPGLVEAILEGTAGPDLTLKRLLEPFPVDWSRQKDHFH